LRILKVLNISPAYLRPGFVSPITIRLRILKEALHGDGPLLQRVSPITIRLRILKAKVYIS